MDSSLIIVESPAKVRSMHKYLGSKFTALATYGPIRELPSRQDAVDPENEFAMHYALLKRNQLHLNAILNAAEQADKIYLATDPDREGEAIAWHLHEILKDNKLLENKLIYRVVFHELTHKAICDAISNPRTLCLEMVDAQQARLALDHLVGFHLSPLLWKKIRQGLSAGRVQSPALRMIVDRETEIHAFKAQEYWSITANSLLDKNNEKFEARLHLLEGKQIEAFSITDESAAMAAKTRLDRAANGRLLVSKVRTKQHRRHPPTPFTTSSLQQDAARKFGFSAQRTMRAAQRLYEGLDGDGLITYIRTDSVNLASEASADILKFIEQEYGPDLLAESPPQHQTSTRNAQEAHEAIRPTDITRTPESLNQRLEYDHLNLYTLIWERTLASQMIHSTIDSVSADLCAGDLGVFRASGSSMRHPGFLQVYQQGSDNPDQENTDKQPLPSLNQGEWLKLPDIEAEQHFTRSPGRYTEASLIRALEFCGIGRPSTYATIISMLLNREYITLEKKYFFPTDIGNIISEFLSEHFGRYVDDEFTAELENQLDAIAHGKKQWKPVVHAFWTDFKQQLAEKETSVRRSDVNHSRVLGTDPKTGKPISVRMGQYGAFAQIGTRDDADKPRFASLEPGQRLDSISREDALALFILPRQLGKTAEGEPVSTAIGRFGPYVRYADQYVSLLKDDSPYAITLEHALELIAQKKEMDAARYIKVFEKQGIQVIEGRYGPYITDGTTNARVPKKQAPEQLTLEQCKKLIAATASKKKRSMKNRPAK